MGSVPLEPAAAAAAAAVGGRVVAAVSGALGILASSSLSRVTSSLTISHLTSKDFQ